MELDGAFGEKLKQQHQESIRQRQADAEMSRQRTHAELMAKMERANEINRLNEPYNSVKKLLESRGMIWGVMPTSEIEVNESFRLKQSSDGHDLSLRIRFNTRGDEVERYNGFNLSLVMHTDEGNSEQYLTTIQKPLLRASGLPENYGMRTYTTGKDKYEINSYVPSDDEAEFIVQAIREAAEVAGVLTPASANTVDFEE